MAEKITETVNPAAVGWTITSDEGTQIQVAWSRDSHNLMLGMCPAGGRWVNYGLLDRDRWSHDGTLNGAREVAHRFLNAE